MLTYRESRQGSAMIATPAAAGGPPTRPNRILISYAGADRLWGEWIGEQFERYGLQVERRGRETDPSADLRELMDQGLESADLVLVGSAYLRAGVQASDDWRAAVDMGLVHRDAFVPVLVGRCELPPRFWQL